MLSRIVVATAALFFSAAALAAPAAGNPAPDFTATDAISGKEISLADFKGKRVVLEWNNFGCPFVKKFYGSNTMQALQRGATTAGTVWITVNSSAEGKEGHLADGAAVNIALKEHDARPSYYVLDHDGAIGKLYSAKTTPHMFVIDKEGNLAYSGAIDSKGTTDPKDIEHATNYVIEALTALGKGQPVKVSYTQPYGCSVKYGF